MIFLTATMHQNKRIEFSFQSNNWIGRNCRKACPKKLLRCPLESLPSSNLKIHSKDAMIVNRECHWEKRARNECNGDWSSCNSGKHQDQSADTFFNISDTWMIMLCTVRFKAKNIKLAIKAYITSLPEVNLIVFGNHKLKHEKNWTFYLSW